jgi:hypothetical protein
MTPIETLKKRAKELLTTEHEFVDSIEVILSTDKKYGYQDGQRLGMYNPLTKRITLYDTQVDNIFPTYMHELIHAMQHRNMGTLMYLLTLTVCRPLFEAGAREIENDLYRDIQRQASLPANRKVKK